MSWEEFKKKKKQEENNNNTETSSTNEVNINDINEKQMSSWQKFKASKQSYSNTEVNSWQKLKDKKENKKTTIDLQDEEKENTWFSKGELFNDGYQFGDISGTVAGTVGDVGVNLVKGAGGLVEGVGDLISYGRADIADYFGNTNKANEIRKEAQVNKIDEVFEPADDFFDKYSVLGEISDSVVEGLGYVAGITAVSIASGGIGGALGASASTAATIGSTATTFASAMGNGMTEALNDGASIDEARIYGAIAGAAEAGSELMFGGLGKASEAIGLSKGALDDVITSGLTKNIKNKMVKTIVQSGIKAGGEGLEEVVSGLISSVGKKVTYMKDQELKEIIKDENLAEQFWMGALTSAIAQGPSTLRSIRSGTDYVTGRTNNEQKVYNNEVNERTNSKIKEQTIEQAYNEQIKAQENLGVEITEELKQQIMQKVEKAYDSGTLQTTELNKKDILKIQDEVETDMQEGNISYENIMKTLGENQDLSKDNLLLRSMYENEQKYNSYKVEQTDNEKVNTLMQSAAESGMNNTSKTRKKVELISKLVKDTDRQYKFVSPEQLKQMGYNENANGLIDKSSGEILINAHTDKGIQSIVGHETTHIFDSKNSKGEYSKEYQTLQKAAIEYAKTKGIYDSKIKSITEAYGDLLVDETQVREELTADLVGDFLFNDEKFIENLAVKDRNVFQKIYDYIKHTYRMMKGTDEEKAFENLKYQFEKVYKTISTETDADTKYSIAGEKAIENIKNTKLYKEAEENLKLAQQLKKEGKSNLELVKKTGWFQDQAGDWKFEFSDKNMELKKVNFAINKEYSLSEILAHDELFYFYPELADTKVIFVNKDGSAFSKKGNIISISSFLINDRTELKATLIHEIQHNIQNYENYAHGASVKGGVMRYLNTLGEIEAADTKQRYLNNINGKTNTILPETAKTNPTHQQIKDGNILAKIANGVYNYLHGGNKNVFKNKKNMAQNSGKNRTLVDERGRVKYSIQESENNSGSFSLPKQDNKGRVLSKQQVERYRNVSELLKDEDGKLKTYYHGTQRADRVGNYFNPEKATSGPMAFFTDSEEIATNYANDKADTSLSREYDTEKDLFKVENKSLDEYWDSLSSSEKQKINENGRYIGFDEDWENIVFDKTKDSFSGQYDYYLKRETNNNGIEALYKVFIEDGNLYGEDMKKFQKVLELAGVENIDYLDPYKIDKKVYEVYLNIKNPFDTSAISKDMVRVLKEASNNATIGEQYSADMWDKSNITPEAWMQRLNDDIKNNTAHAWTVIPDWVTEVLKKNGYDGISDTGGKNGGQKHQVIIPFYSEQIKNIDNTNPTDNPDIRFSMTNDAQITGDDIAVKDMLKQERVTIEDEVGNNQTKEIDIDPKENINTIDLQEYLDEHHVDYSIDEDGNITSIENEDVLQDYLNSKEVNEKDTKEQKSAYKELQQKYKQMEIGKREYEKLLRREKPTDVEKITVDRLLKGEIENNEIPASANRQRVVDLYNAKAKFYNVEQEIKERRKEIANSYRDLAKDMTQNISEWKDKKRGIQYQVNTMKRNLRDIIPNKSEADAVYNEYFRPITKNNAIIEKEISKYNDRISKFDINNTESQYIQMIGENKYNPDSELPLEKIEEFYDNNKNKIDLNKCQEAVKEFRNIYDELIVKINDTLIENGYKTIEYRQGYFPHFTENKAETMLGKFAEKLGWKVNADTLPTDIAGITDQFKPGKAWTSFSQQRKGDSTDYNALKGYDNYIRGAMDVIYHTNDIQKLRALENEIRYQYSEKGVQEKIDNIYSDNESSIEEKQQQINEVFENIKNNPMGNLATELRSYTDSLANKKSRGDRSMEQDWGRQTYSIMTNIQNRVSANMVGANISSALTNFIPITQAWSQTSTKNTMKAIKESIAIQFNDDGFSENSTFLTNRTEQADRLYKTGLDKVNNKLGYMFDVVDSFTSNVIVRAKYYDNIDAGMNINEAMNNADEFAKDVMAGRSKGDMPTLFNKKNPMVKLFTAFQLEVNNQYGYMLKDLPADLGGEAKEKLVGAFVKMFLGAYLYNIISEKITGRKSAFSPIDMAIDSYETATNDELSSGEKIVSIGEDIVGELPFIGGIAGGGRLPIQGAIPYDDPVSMVSDTITNLSDVFDADNDNKQTAINSLLKEWSRPLCYVALPFAGGQLKKSVEGLSMYLNDVPGSYANNGDLRFTVDDDISSKIKATIFGTYANPYAQDYIDSGYKSISKDNIEEMVGLDMNSTEYREYKKGLNQYSKTEEKLNYINSLDLTDSQKTLAANNLNKNSKKQIDMSEYGNYSSYDEYKYARDYPEKYSVISQITDYDSYEKYKNDISDIKKKYSTEAGYKSEERKSAIQSYINSLDLNMYQKMLLEKMAGGYSIKNYKTYIQEYLDTTNLTQSEKYTIWEELFN